MKVYGPYDGVVKDIHDGDTLGIDVDLGMNDYILARNPITGDRDCSCRLYGINAPELSTQAGKDALAYLETLVKPGDKVTVYSHSWDKYSRRFDGTVITVDRNLDLSKAMLDSGHAVVMAG